MSKKSDKEDPLRFTTIITDPALRDGVKEVAALMGVGLTDLARQGLIRVVLEYRAKGGVQLLPLLATQEAVTA